MISITIRADDTAHAVRIIDAINNAKICGAVFQTATNVVESKPHPMVSGASLTTDMLSRGPSVSPSFTGDELRKAAAAAAKKIGPEKVKEFIASLGVKTIVDVAMEDREAVMERLCIMAM